MKTEIDDGKLAHVHLTLPDELLKLVDEARGDTSRNAWIRRAITNRLELETGQR
jgi:metal-responsive CopG/Arc/MetJ family transcriptional regulator